MPYGLNRKSIPLVLASLVFAVTLGVAGSAFAALEDSPDGLTSTTNPALLSDPAVSWRWHWGNSRYPQLTIGSIPTDPDIVTDGIYYNMTQSVEGTPPVGGPHLSALGTGTMLTGTVDLDGVVEEAGWIQQPGAAISGEGLWYLHFRFYNQFRAQDGYWSLPFGIDMTAPEPVANLTAGVTASSTTTGWTTATRRVLKWTPSAYDALSGVGGFAITVNGEEKVFVRNVAPDPAVEWWAGSLNPTTTVMPQIATATIEDLPVGSNKIGVTVVDRATNRSETRYVYANIDPDVPTIALTAPTASVVGKYATLSATASDQGGVSKVVFQVDGVTVGTDTTAPYSVTADMSVFGSGSHTVTATVYDMMGRTKAVSKTVTADVTAPVLSSVSGSPSTFYPKKRNGYRDDYIVKLKASEACQATLIFKTSKGTTFKTIKTNVKAGSNTIKWNGKSGGGNFKEGTYKWTLVLTDAAGNTSTTKSGKATERFYQLVKVGKNKVKLVLR